MDDTVVGLFGGAFLVVWILLAVAYTVFWILMLVNAAKTQQWAWFVLMLLFSCLAPIYFFVGRRPVA